MMDSPYFILTKLSSKRFDACLVSFEMLKQNLNLLYFCLQACHLLDMQLKLPIPWILFIAQANQSAWVLMLLLSTTSWAMLEDWAVQTFKSLYCSSCTNVPRMSSSMKSLYGDNPILHPEKMACLTATCVGVLRFLWYQRQALKKWMSFN